ncbi:MAG: type II secretion system protein [Burkholderiales bacterium]|nr:type II secretion system protein [Burkholderiales bacterium]
MKQFQTCRIRLPSLQSGFSLVELAIVMLIVSILLAGVLMPLSMQREVRSYADTKKTMDDIREALIGFALANGRLPCPATKNLADGTAGAGTEALTGNACAATSGVIPWVTLNVPETDEWGGRFTYRVTSTFGDTYANSTWGCTPGANPASPASFALCASGDMKIQSRTTAKAAYDLTNLALPAVFVSHGKNGRGAYRSNGVQIAPAPGGTDELTNAATGTTTFISREITPESASCSDAFGTNPMCEFDDLVAFVPLSTLMNRMILSQKLP